MIDLEEMQIFLPSYLNEDSKSKLYEELGKFSADGFWIPYGVGSVYPAKLLQGDALDGLSFISFPDPRVKKGLALVLSNSCDLDTDNERKIPYSIVYCPLIEKQKFEKFVEKVYEKGSKDFLEKAKQQSISNIIYFPERGTSSCGYYALLDRICHQSRDSVSDQQVSDNKVFTLSNVGFYLFLIKISMHFTRIHEKIDRDSA